jgi:hypothetical protein
MSHCRSLLVAFAVAGHLAFAPVCTGPALAQQVGTAAAVNPAAQARGPGGARTIVIGNAIAHRERIQTTSAGSVQLIFLDKTSMTVGPNSDLANDEYVYDPATNTGKLAATLTKGVMRFVGGQISHAGNAQVATPTAVIGIRGGVGIFHPNSVYIGFGEGQVRSGSSTVTLSAGDYTQTAGGGLPPTTPGPPPAGFLQSVISTLQSRPGQGGGARASAAQISQARRVATGSAAGNIARNVNNALSRPVNATTETLSWITPTIVTALSRFDGFQPPVQDGAPGSLPPIVTQPDPTVTQPLPPITQPTPPITQPNPTVPQPTPTAPQPSQTLFGYTGGLIHSVGQNGLVGQSSAAVGWTSLRIDPARNRSQANLRVRATSHESQNALRYGRFQFGSLDPNLPSGNTTVGTAEALLPAVGSNGKPLSTVNRQPLTQHTGRFVEVKPGNQLSDALSSSVGPSFCQCDYTRWGLWDSQFSRPGPNNSTIEEHAQMFWVAGRLPNRGDVPTQGIATYDGHAIAAIRNEGRTYVAAGTFRNDVNFGTRTGAVSVTDLDSTNYAGRISFFPDRRFFAGHLSGVNSQTGVNQNRSMLLNGSFFTGASSPVGEMGGALRIRGPDYLGSGIFAGQMK